MARCSAPEPGLDPERRGAGIVNAAYAGSALFVVSSLAAVAFPDSLATAAAVVDLVLFAVGCAAFFWAYAAAVARSRHEEIVLAGLFFLSGNAPKAVAFRLRGAFAIQVVVAIVAASLRPFTPLAFGVLVPVLGLGLMGLWGARYGTFSPRTPTGRAAPGPTAAR